MVIRVLAGLVGLGMAAVALNWIVDPASAAAGLDMALVSERPGRSTQIGDFIAFFASVALMIAVGLFRRAAAWLKAAALVLGLAAAGRTVAWLAHGAAFAPKFIAIEVAMAVVLLLAAAATDRGSQKPQAPPK